MVRVMFYTGISVVLVSAALLYLPICFSYVLASLLLLFLLLLILLRKRITVNGIKTLTLITLVFCLVGISTLLQKVKPAESLVGYTAEITATVTEWPDYYDDYTSYIATTESIAVLPEEGKAIPDKVPQKLKIRISDVYNNDFMVFDKFTATVTINSLGNYRTSSYSSGIYASGQIVEVTDKLGQNRPFYAVFYDLREYINGLLYDNINYDEASVASAVLIGDHSQLDTNFYTQSKIIGITHMLVVSGAHFGIIFELLGAIMVFLKVPRRINASILIFSIFVLATVCGFSPSILRAGLTYFVIALGRFFFLKPDSLNSLGVAATLITFFSPFSAGNVAFLLSFLSTFGLIFACPEIYKKLLSFASRFYRPKAVSRAILFSISQTLSATLFTLPVLILVYGYVSTLTLVANLLTGYAMSLIMVFSLFAVVILSLPFVFNAAAVVFTVPLCLLIRYVKWITRLLADFDYALLPADTLYIIPCMLMLAGLILAVITCSDDIYSCLKIRLKNITAILLALFVISFTVTTCLVPTDNVAVVDVGKGSAIVISYKNTIIVIGAGDGKSDTARIENAILNMGKTDIDYLILPSLDKNIAGGGAALIRQLPVARVILPRSGEYYNELEYVAGENSIYFDNTCLISANGYGQILIYKENGVIINLEELSAVLYLKGTALELLSNLENPCDSFICAGNVPEDMAESEVEKIILSGETDIIKEFYNKNSLSKGVDNTFNGSVIIY